MDRLHLSELTDRIHAETLEHVRDCETCQTRMSERERGFSAFSELDTEALFGQIRCAIKNAENDRRASRRWRAIRLYGSVAAALVAMICVVVISAPPEPTREGVGNSGGGRGLSFQVFRKRSGGTLKTVSGDGFDAAAQLSFRARRTGSGEPGHFMVVGIEPHGNLAVRFPRDGRSFAAQRSGVLEGTIELHASSGEQSLHLVWCPHPFSAEALVRGTSSDELGIPDVCRRDVFHLSGGLAR